MGQGKTTGSPLRVGRRAATAAAAMTLLGACTHPVPKAPAAAAAPTHAPSSPQAVAFLRSRLQPFATPSGDGLLAVTEPEEARAAIYDSALVALVLLRAGERETSGRLLSGLYALKSGDGSLPFSLKVDGSGWERGYVRSGAMAWVGYAATEYLDAEAGGRARGIALDLAHRVAGYLLSHRIDDEKDPRYGLVRGGEGTMFYEAVGGRIQERFEPGTLGWVSVEHNVDTFFFLRALARVTGTRVYADAADRIQRTLSSAWNEPSGQLVRGITPRGLDTVPALDCASWGAVFLAASGDRARAEISVRTARKEYAVTDSRSGAKGHRAYAYGPVLEDPVLMQHLGHKLPAREWEKIAAIWPEGTAGVALAALRTGDVEGARGLLAALEPLRARDGSLPTSTVVVPFLFDTNPSIAGTAWVELVRYDLARPDRPTFWLP